MKQPAQKELPLGDKRKNKERERILSLLGCYLTDKPDVYAHDALNCQLNLSKVPLEEVLSYVASVFRNIGYTHCQENIRRALGLE